MLWKRTVIILLQENPQFNWNCSYLCT